MEPMQLRALPPADLVAPRVWTSSQSPLTRFWSDVPACIERTVSCEFRNRLDLGAGTNMTPEVQAIARRFGPAVAQWSRIELRDAIERVLRREGLPPIGKEFQAHNERVDAVCEHLLDSGDMPLPTTLASWLRQLASANLIEVWPGSSTDSLFLKNRVAVPPCTSDPFDSLSSRLHQRLGKGAPVGLFTDNHGEVVFDTAFLSWVLRVYAVPVCAFAKSQGLRPTAQLHQSGRSGAACITKTGFGWWLLDRAFRATGSIASAQRPRLTFGISKRRAACSLSRESRISTA